MALIHGGQLQQVAEKYNIPYEKWLDLSTGIAPISYPIPVIPEHLYQELPQSNNVLENAAREYYGADDILVTNGSQAIIKLLPSMWRAQNPGSTSVYLPIQGYKEHALAWELAGYTLHWYHDELPELPQIAKDAVLIVINPNNPTGKLFSQELLLKYQQHLTKSNGLLVVDEAFMDVITPNQSLASTLANNLNTLVLRSFGKFFGLAGIRIGFLLGQSSWLSKFKEQLGPWQVNGPAQFIAQHALQDRHWQAQQRDDLSRLSSDLLVTLTQRITGESIVKIAGTDLFQTIFFKPLIDVESLYITLCTQGIYVRLTDDKKALRFGLLKAPELKRLSQALDSLIYKAFDK